MANSGNRTRHLWLPNHGDVHTFVLVKVLMALQEWTISRKGKKRRFRRKITVSNDEQLTPGEKSSDQDSYNNVLMTSTRCKGEEFVEPSSSESSRNSEKVR